jgi:hypothetical protein
MSFYSDASLVMIPSGYKDQKVYCAKPTDGAGDLVFSRASGATRVGPDGLIEKVRTNLVKSSGDISTQSTYWTSNQSGSTTQNAAVAPDGTTTASQITSVGSSYSGVTQSSISVAAVPHTYSCYLKAVSGTPTVRLTFFDGVTFHQGNFTITSEWVRYSFTFTPLAGSFAVYNSCSAVATWLAWGAQLEASDVMTDYIATTSAAVSVGPVSGLPRLDYLGSTCPRLILEGQRTNAALWSENFDNAAWTKIQGSVTANAATSPDGYANADKLIPDNGLNALLQQLIVITATTHTFSVFAKDDGITTFGVQSRDNATAANFASVTFDLSSGTIVSSTSTGTYSAQSGTITNYGNGWYRCTLTFTSSGSTTTRFRIQNDELGDGTKGLLLYGAQAELGASYATSYVNTLGSSVTRVADACSKTGISSLIGQTEGTLFFDVTLDQRATYTYFVIAPNIGSSSVYIGILMEATRLRAEVVNSGTQASIPFNNTSTGRFKAALAYKANDVAFYVNGTLVGTDTSATIPACSEFALNNYDREAAPKYSQALLFKTRLTNAQLAELTTL